MNTVRRHGQMPFAIHVALVLGVATASAVVGCCVAVTAPLFIGRRLLAETSRRHHI